MPRLRFTLRFLLVITTIAAAGFGVWQNFFVERIVLDRDAAKVKIGMTALEVRWRLGSPHFKYRAQPIAWCYNLEGTSEYMKFDFKSGRVSTAELRSYMSESALPHTELPAP